METLTVGERVVLEDEKEYICFRKINDGGRDYVFLVSNFKPLKVFFAEEIRESSTLRLELVSDPEEKKRLLPLFGVELPTSEPPKAPEEPARTLDGEICEHLSVGESIELENMGDYVCYRKINYEGKAYLCLMSHGKPRSFLFAEETVKKGIYCVIPVEDPEKHNRLMQLVRKKPWDTIKQLFKREPKKK